MTDNDIDTFVEALLCDRAPKELPVAPEERDILQFAIALRAYRPGFAGPEPEFVEQLHRQLASAAPVRATIVPLQASTHFRDGHDPVPARSGGESAPVGRVTRQFRTLAKAAAAAVLVAGTFTATHLVDSHSPVPVAQAPAGAGAVRSGVLLSASGRPLGRAYTYTGNPTWVFMDVQASTLSGVYVCRLQLANGSTVPAGVVTVYNGAGDWAHTVKVPSNQLRGATLVASDGAVMARATFS